MEIFNHLYFQITLVNEMKNPKVSEYITNATNWNKEMKQLRIFLLDCNLTEELKWKVPCYCYNKTNLIIIGKFKEYVTLSFFKGVLLNDSEQILVSPGENSQTVKMIKFTSLEEIIKLEKTIKSYIYEAIEVERLGLKVEFKKSSDLVLVEELQDVFNHKPKFKQAFDSLTPGRQRAYNIYYSSAKQSKTRISRIENSEKRILLGFGPNDCTCGMTMKKPNCDGSHKSIEGFVKL